MLVKMQGEFLEVGQGGFKNADGQEIKYFQLSLLQGSEVTKLKVSDELYPSVATLRRMSQVELTAEIKISNYNGKNTIRINLLGADQMEGAKK